MWSFISWLGWCYSMPWIWNAGQYGKPPLFFLRHPSTCTSVVIAEWEEAGFFFFFFVITVYFPPVSFRDLSGNPFFCDCNLAWLPRWVEERNVKVSHPSETQCAQPLELADLPLFNISFSDATCGKAEKGGACGSAVGKEALESRSPEVTIRAHKTGPQFCTGHLFT